MRLACLLLLPALLGGCATLFHGTKSEITVDSRPQQASFSFTTAGNGSLSNAPGLVLGSGVTPATVTLPNKNDYVLSLKLAGYQETRVLIDRSLNGWFICSAICGLIPGGVDALTGAMWNLEPEQITVTLAPAGAPAAPLAAPPADGTSASNDDITNIDGVELVAHAVVFRKGSDGQLRYLSVPLVREAL